MSECTDTDSPSRPSLRQSVLPFRTSGGRRRTALALVLCALLIGLVVVPRAIALLGLDANPREQAARHVIDAYVHQAYPAWRMVTSRVCPISIGELSAFIGRRDAIDMWGTPFAMYCTDTRSGAHTIVVRSAGEDTRFGTADDLWSDR